jgi:signal transduction histidine kinase
VSVPLRILILTDISRRRLALERVFRQARHPATFLQAASYEIFVRSLEQAQPDAILALYPLDGWDLKTAIPITRVLASSTPFIVISGSPDVREAVSWMKAGADEYLAEGEVDRLPEVIADLQQNRTELASHARDSSAILHFSRLVLDHMPIQIAVYDAEGRYWYVNIAAVRSPEMRQWLPGKTDFDYCRQRNLPMHIAEQRTAAIAQCLAEKRQVEFEEEFPSPHEGNRYLTRFLSPMLDSDGTVIHVIGTSIDHTERKRLETQLQYAQKLEGLGILAGGIAHDFNNLLTVILGHAELIKAQLIPESRMYENTRAIVQASHRAANLCNQMLAYAGKGKLVVKSCHVKTIIEEMQELLAASVSKNVHLKYRLAPHLPAIKGDPNQLQQVILNLVTNGSEAIEENEGTVTISTGIMECDAAYFQSTYFNDHLPDGLYVYIQVEDTGSGMDEATQNMMFDPFFTTKFTGRGLGLAAVLGIVRSHHGAIRIDSQLKKGTIMRVLFPATEWEEAEINGTLQEPDWRGKGTVLVVDDEESVRVMSRVMLKRLGFSALTAVDGVEAMAVFGRHQRKITLVMLDVVMPRLNGEDTFWELRKIRPDMPMLLLSGYGEEILSKRLLAEDQVEFIQKPYSMADLTEKIRTLVEG